MQPKSTKQKSVLTLVLSSFLLMASASGGSSQATPWRWDTSFSTRLSGQLLISGQRCLGGETTQVMIEGQEIIIHCPTGKWLVVVDNINRCSPEGQCTEVAVSPVVTALRKSNHPTASTLAFYNFIPRSPLSVAQAVIMKRHWVRFNLNGEPLVLEK